ncbi:MAG: inverse autotransporter beta domain-containing protein [Alphaproteobacteria bacterium]|nr:inverse autotransporter beta domain-containing protein [Alphaproteobacteria bacterium]MDD9919906.1 inverse autotransporter beta domain-containing protein [Alphaproteobacteria bacterium]
MRFIACIGMFLAASISWGSSQKEWQPVVDVSTKVGNQRTIGTVDFILPINQNDDSLVFADIRGTVTSHGGKEINLGVGYRQIKNIDFIDRDVIYGVYGFFDHRRSPYDNYFSQVTLGGEVLTDTWDMRLNWYQPLTKDGVAAYSPGGTKGSLYLDGSLFKISNGESYEHALHGFDIEIGRRLPGMARTRAYLAHYNFGGGEQASVDGVRTRLQSHVTDWIKLEGEYSYDQVRSNNFFVGATVRVPLNFSFNGDKLWLFEKQQEISLRSRMLEPIVRDVDIVTKAETLSDIPVLTVGGEQVEVWVVDNSVAVTGIGTFEQPFKTLAEASAVAGANDVIYISYGDGTSTGLDNGLVINSNNTRVIGEGVAFTFDESGLNLPDFAIGSLQGTMIRAAGSAPVLTNASGDGISITASTDVEIAGLTVSGTAQHGIHAANVSNLNINNVTVSHNSGSGIFINATAGTSSVTIANINSTNNGVNGLDIAVNGNGINLQNLNVINSTLNSNTQDGIGVQVLAGTLKASKFTSNTLNNNTVAGIYIDNQNSVQDVLLQQNSIASSGADGVLLHTQNSGKMTSTTVAGNIIQSAGGRGIYVQAQSLASVTSVVVSENTIQGSTNENIYATLDSGAVMDALIVRDNSMYQGDQGVEIRVTGVDSKAISTTINGNHISATTHIGSILYVDGGGVIDDLQFTQNRIENTGHSALFAQVGEWGVANGGELNNVNIVSNTLVNNANQGIELYSPSGHTATATDIKIEGNDLTSNGHRAVRIGDYHSSRNVFTNIDMGGGATGSTGNNRIAGSGVDPIYVDTNGQEVKAQNNWWGSSSGLSGATVVSGTIDSTGYLTSDPGAL